MEDNLQNHYDFPTPLLHLTFILQQSSDNLLDSGLGLGLSAMRILSALQGKRICSQQDISRILGQTEANTSRQLKQMKKQGLVSITKNKKDKRQRDVILTQKGSSLYKKAIKVLAAQQHRLFYGLKKSKQSELEQTLHRIINNI